jgi:hypothetical protein
MVCVAVMLLSLAGLGGAALAQDGPELFYPLKEGLQWEYQAMSGGAAAKIVITNLALREVEGKKATPRKWETGGGVKYIFVAQDGQGIYRLAEQVGDQGAVKPVTPKVYYLHTPVAVGTTWDIVTQRGEDSFTINLTVESVSEEVKAPAGVYKDCLMVKHQGSGGQEGAKVSVSAYEWYAPKVGLVKSLATIKKQVPGKPEQTETHTFHLQSFKQ